MFNKEYVGAIMNLYGCQLLAVDREGKVYAMKPEMHQLIPDLMLDTDSAVASEEAAAAAIKLAQG